MLKFIDNPKENGASAGCVDAAANSIEFLNVLGPYPPNLFGRRLDRPVDAPARGMGDALVDG